MFIFMVIVVIGALSGLNVNLKNQERRQAMRRPYIYLLSMGVLLLLTSVVWCKDTEFNSIWRKAEITVDGAESEWSGLFYYLEEQKVGLGLQNDTDNLYVIIKATDRNTQLQIMRTGLTIWLDATGKKKKTLGIHYPIGMQDYGMPLAMDRQPSQDSSKLQKQFTEMLDKIEILGPGKNDKNRINRVNNSGIEASVNDTLGVMVCEFKIPLKQSNELPYAIAANIGSVISLGLETGELKQEMMKEKPPMGEGMPGGGGGMPPGGMPPGGRGGMPGGREGIKMSEPIKFWAKVSLAKAVVDKN